MLTESEMNRNIVLLSDPNKITRQKALQNLCNDLKSLSIDTDNENHIQPPPNIIESMLKIFPDPAEKNRDLALTYISMYITQYCKDILHRTRKNATCHACNVLSHVPVSCIC